MIPTAYFFGVATAVLMLVVIVEMLRRRRLRERHALWWLVLGLLNLVAALFPSLLEATSRLLGIEVPTNLVFFVGIIVLFFVSVQQSSELTKLEERNRRLAEEHSLLENRVSGLERQLSDSARE